MEASVCLPASLSELFVLHFGVMPEHVDLLPMSGGARRYFRMRTGNMSAIGTLGTDMHENDAFVSLARIMLKAGILVPDIYGYNRNDMTYLQEDVGDVSLYSILSHADVRERVSEAMCALAHIQTSEAVIRQSEQWCKPFGRRLVMWDLNYFKYDFLKVHDVSFDEEMLEDDFDRMCHRLSTIPQELCGFMYRDCQSRNVMLHRDRLYWIDFQGGRRGPCPYDAVSFLWQARARFSTEFRHEMTEIYAKEFAAIRKVSAQQVVDAVYDMVPLRVLQTLGAYGYRGLIQHKEHFIASIPAAISNLRQLAFDALLDPYPELKRISLSIK